MTGTPVNGVGSLLNYAGSRVAQTANVTTAAGAFGDVMSKASGNQSGADFVGKTNSGKTAAVSTKKPSYTGKEISQTGSAENSAETKKTETDVTQTTAKAANDTEEAVQEAGKELVKEIADKLGVSEEEVIDAMEELGFGLAAILNPEHLTQLVLTLSGEDNSLALLTNESLYATVQELLQNLDTLQVSLAEALGITPEEVAKLMEEEAMKQQLPDSQRNQEEILLTQEAAGKEQEAKITVTVEQGDESITLKTDEKGNVLQVEGVTDGREVPKETQSGQEKGRQDGAGENAHENTTANPLVDNLLQSKVQTAEGSFEQATIPMTQNAEEIMNQILDYMKIQLKPGMDQLTMQLHPESLGNLHIQITSKGGEVTAQFHVQDEAVKAAIESQVAELKETLKNQGIKVEAVEVTVESHAFESNLWQGQERDDSASYQNERKSPRRINLDALEGIEELTEEEDRLAAEMMEANGNTVDYTA